MQIVLDLNATRGLVHHAICGVWLAATQGMLDSRRIRVFQSVMVIASHTDA